MSEIRIKDLTNTATSAADDDYLALDGSTAGSRKILASKITTQLADNVKTALLDCFAHVAWIDEYGQTYYDALNTAINATTWAITNTLTNCTTSNAAASVTKGDPYTATIEAATGYTLTGATVTVTMNGVDVTSTVYSNDVITISSVTGDVVITAVAAEAEVTSISAVYTQSGTVYTDDDLDTLKADLVVTATFEDSSTAVLSSDDYTLSGTLVEGTSTITVTYEDVTTTFDVTVIDFYNIWSWSYANGDLTKVTQSSLDYLGSVSDTTKRLQLNNGTATYRRHFCVEKGKWPYFDHSTLEALGYYPIPAPSTANKVTISITPSTQYMYTQVVQLSDSVYTRLAQQGWTQGTTTVSWTAGEDVFVFFNTKYDSSGSSYPTEPTDVVVTFEEV